MYGPKIGIVSYIYNFENSNKKRRITLESVNFFNSGAEKFMLSFINITKSELKIDTFTVIRQTMPEAMVFFSVNNSQITFHNIMIG